MLKFWIAVYVLLLVVVVSGMFMLRRSTLTEMGTPSATAEWNRWREAAAQQDGTKGPVQRTVPKSNEPPLLLLMRDYFTAALVGLLLPLSALCWFIAWLVWGVSRQAEESRAARSQRSSRDFS